MHHFNNEINAKWFFIKSQSSLAKQPYHDTVWWVFITTLNSVFLLVERNSSPFSLKYLCFLKCWTFLLRDSELTFMEGVSGARFFLWWLFIAAIMQMREQELETFHDINCNFDQIKKINKSRMWRNFKRREQARNWTWKRVKSLNRPKVPAFLLTLRLKTGYVVCISNSRSYSDHGSAWQRRHSWNVTRCFDVESQHAGCVSIFSSYTSLAITPWFLFWEREMPCFVFFTFCTLSVSNMPW